MRFQACAAQRAGTGRMAMTLETPPTSATAHVTTPSGQVISLPDGRRMVFGRGPGTDLAIAAGRGLSRRAGVISAVGGGAWVANISRTHALYAEGDGYRIRLPRMEDRGEGTRGGGRGGGSPPGAAPGAGGGGAGRTAKGGVVAPSRLSRGWLAGDAGRGGAAAARCGQQRR